MLISIPEQKIQEIFEILAKNGKVELLHQIQQETRCFLTKLERQISEISSIEHDTMMTKDKDNTPKTFSDFDFEQARKILGFESKRENLFPEVAEENISTILQANLDFAEKKTLRNEKARSEYIIVPILSEIERNHSDTCQVFSGENINVDKSKGLKGEIDFTFVADPQAMQIKDPIFTLVEAKTGDITQHYGQIAAQMVGAREFNKLENNEIDTIYGCLTTGENWLFMKLENNQFFIDKRTYYITEIKTIVGIFNKIINFYKKPQ